MYIILLSLLMSSTAYSKDIEVHFDQLKYNLHYTMDSVSYTGTHVELSLKKKTCNEHLLKRFNLLMDKVLTQKLSTTEGAHSYKLTIDKKIYFESKATTRATFFKNFDKFFKQIKTEEYVNCES